MGEVVGEEDDYEDQTAPLLPLVGGDGGVLLRRGGPNATSQVALFGDHLCPIESLDYELVENDFFKQDWRSRDGLHIVQYVLLKWSLCFLIAPSPPSSASSTTSPSRTSPARSSSSPPTSCSHKSTGQRSRSSPGPTSCSPCSPPPSPPSSPPPPRAPGSPRSWPTSTASTPPTPSPSGPCSSRWRSSLLWRAFFTTAVVAVVLRALIDVCTSGKCGLFGKGGLIMFDVTSDGVAYSLVDLPPVIILGVIGGVLGSLYNFLLEKLLRVYSLINEKGRAYKLLLAAFVSICTSCCLFGLPWFASCRPCPAGLSEPCPSIGRSGNFKKFQCPPDHYNDLASLFFNTNDDTIRNLYSAGTDNVFNTYSVLLFFVTSYFLGIFSYGLVLPSGLFVPVILTGATYGRLIAMLMGEHSTLDHGLFAVLGSASLLGGSMRITMSVCVIILELTNNLLLLPLVMLVLLISKTVADTMNSNIYDLLVKLKGLPYLEAHAEPYMRQLTVSDIVTGPLQMFHGVEKVGNIVHILKTTGHNGFPVIDEPPFSGSPVLFGLILRAHLLVLLKKRDFLHSCSLAGSSASKQFSADDFAKSGSGKGDSIEDICLTAEEMDMFLDLHPFTNSSPYTVVETMSLAKALLLFRELGLRHLLVIPKCHSRAPVVGILTRHDFMPEHILDLHPILGQSRRKRLRFGKATLIRLFGGLS
ncbi:putative chloride channel-like protein CLC-g [Iris pallida]|uniref:Chloride channel protein n=1 Tax=Iris pallida TaxID=29817 RepID=A0AAX6DW57_IRIPA|nr:putative chloride channel-like protein CLC-g [Iris pallida]